MEKQGWQKHHSGTEQWAFSGGQTKGGVPDFGTRLSGFSVLANFSGRFLFQLIAGCLSFSADEPGVSIEIMPSFQWLHAIFSLKSQNDFIDISL